VRAGEQFTVQLRASSQGALRGLPLLIGFDPRLLQVVNVQEGGFFKQNGGTTQFSQRVDQAQGKVFVAAVRQNATGQDAGVNGMGAVVAVTFKALKPSGSQGGTAKILVLSASPEPPPSAPLSLPVEQLVRVVP
jgi:general secretion pathway protein D